MRDTFCYERDIDSSLHVRLKNPPTSTWGGITEHLTDIPGKKGGSRGWQKFLPPDGHCFTIANMRGASETGRTRRDTPKGNAICEVYHLRGPFNVVRRIVTPVRPCGHHIILDVLGEIGKTILSKAVANPFLPSAKALSVG